MPNCCYGTLQIISSEECMKVIVELISGTADDGTPMFDFAKVISIPDMLKERHKAYRESHSGAIYSANYKKKGRG